MSYIDIKTAKVHDSYHKALGEVDIQVYNAMYEAMEGAAATAFGDGWLAATMWMCERRGWMDEEEMDENLSEKTRLIHERYPIFNGAKKVGE